MGWAHRVGAASRAQWGGTMTASGTRTGLAPALRQAYAALVAGDIDRVPVVVVGAPNPVRKVHHAARSLRGIEGSLLRATQVSPSVVEVTLVSTASQLREPLRDAAVFVMSHHGTAVVVPTASLPTDLTVSQILGGFARHVRVTSRPGHLVVAQAA